MNDCAIWLLSWNHVTIAIVIQISAVCWRRRRLLSLLDEAEIFVRECTDRQRRSRIYLISYHLCLTTLFTIKVAVAMYTGQTTEFAIFILHGISYLVPLTVECLFLLLCSVVKDMCSEINVRLTILVVEKQNVISLTQNLIWLTHSHQNAVNLLKMVSRCFNQDLLIDLAFNMIWFIIYIYVTIVSLCTVGSSTGRNICFVLELIFLASRVCFLSYSVNKIECEVSKMNMCN